MAIEDLTRRLSAILSADVEGYSRLMREDEEATVYTLTTYRTAITHLVNQYRGRVVDSPGDNILAEFTSVVDAVNCGVEIQRELAERNAELPDNRRMRFRIGINLGDVLEEGERIYGDGVNIASRMESLAEADEICISGTVYDAVESKIGLEYDFLGEHEVKNIDKPVRAYRVLSYPGAAAHRVVKAKRAVGKRWRNMFVAIAAVLVVVAAVSIWHFYFRAPPVEVASVEKMAFQLPDKPSIAVLPFVNMSEDPKQEYLADGITENIISALSQVPKLFVIARQSTFAYKGKPVKIQQVAEELGVRYVLEGSVQRSGESLRVIAQFIDAIGGHHLWSERYDRELKNIFALQDEITMKILVALQVKLTQGERARVSLRGTNNLEAYLKNLQGWESYLQLTEGDNVRAREFFQDAIALDPKYSSPYALLGWTHMMDARFGWSESRRESRDRALELAQKAIALGDPTARGRLLLSYIYRQKRQYEESIAEMERVIELNPNFADAHAHLAGRLYAVGRGEEAVASAKKAIRLNPMGPWAYWYWLGMGHWVMGRYEEAIAAYKKALDRRPTALPVQIVLTASYSLLGREEEARAEAAEVLRLNPKFSVEKYAKRLPFKNQALTERYVGALRKAGLPETPPLPLPDKPSIAVLPFVNMSDDPKQEYFSDGMAEDLITDLSKISSFLVTSRNSTFAYKGKSVKPEEIAKELGVRYILEGSVRKVGDEVRINAQLIDASTGHHLWADRYDGQLQDIFQLQDKITRKIVTSLAVKLTQTDRERLALKETDNIQAYDAVLKALDLMHRWSPDNFEKALSYLEKAVELDPNYGRAYAMMGEIYASTGIPLKLNISLEERKLRGWEYIRIALKNPTSVAYRVASLWFYRLERDFERALEAADRALALDPSDAKCYWTKAFALIQAGRAEEALDFIETALRIDPGCLF
jgi:TolB-like protein/class 3 adenylate cyclase/Flp pilus assembly protein TadD